MFERGPLTTAPWCKPEDTMREEIAHLETAIQQILVLLKSDEPLTQKDHAVMTSLAGIWLQLYTPASLNCVKRTWAQTSFPKEA
jgi:hypothetical protein